MKLELTADYKDNNVLRRSFNELSQRVFGISFEEWYQRGLWKGSYICYSYRYGDKIVANVSATRMRLKVSGREKKVVQLGTVMTAPDYRGRGLAGKLMKYVIDVYQDRCEALFLFANKDALDFYPRFGFKKTERMELYTRDKPRVRTAMKFRQLDMENGDDIRILTGTAEARAATSDRFFIADGQEILYWYCLGIFRENVFYDQDRDLIVIYGLDGETLHIYDIIMKENPGSEIPYRDILGSLYREGVRETVFHFNLESEEINIEKRSFDDRGEDDPMFVRGELNMAGVCFPITAHT